MENRAIAYGLGDFVIYDVVNGRANAFEVIEEDFHEGFGSNSAILASLSQTDKQTINIVRDSRIAISTVVNSRTTFSNALTSNDLYLIASDSAVKNSFIDEAKELMGAFDKLALALGSAGDVIAKAFLDSVQGTIFRVDTADGGTVTFMISGGTLDLTPELNIISAKDKDNRDVPFSASDFDGRWELDEDGLENFADTAETMGISLNQYTIPTGGGGSGGGNFIIAITCIEGESSCTVEFISK